MIACRVQRLSVFRASPVHKKCVIWYAERSPHYSGTDLLLGSSGRFGLPVAHPPRSPSYFLSSCAECSLWYLQSILNLRYLRYRDDGERYLTTEFSGRAWKSQRSRDLGLNIESRTTSERLPTHRCTHEPWQGLGSICRFLTSLAVACLLLNRFRISNALESSARPSYGFAYLEMRQLHLVRALRCNAPSRWHLPSWSPKRHSDPFSSIYDCSQHWSGRFCPRTPLFASSCRIWELRGVHRR